MNKKSMAQLKRNLSGPEGLISAVIAQATFDALHGSKPDKVDALRYLRGNTYKAHLQALGVPETWLPDPKE